MEPELCALPQGSLHAALQRGPVGASVPVQREHG
jgi:hypothetical protein